MDSAISSGYIIVGDTYRLLKKIQSGVFGDVYYGKNVTNGDEVAVK